MKEMKYTLFLAFIYLFLICLPVKCEDTTTETLPTKKITTQTLPTKKEITSQNLHRNISSFQIQPFDGELQSSNPDRDEISSQKSSKPQSEIPDAKSLFAGNVNKLRDGKILPGHGDFPKNSIPVSNGVNKIDMKLNDHSYKKEFSTDVEVVVTRKASSISKLNKNYNASKEDIDKIAYEALDPRVHLTSERVSLEIDDSATTQRTVTNESILIYFNSEQPAVQEELESSTEINFDYAETTIIPEVAGLDSSLMYNDSIYMEPISYSTLETTTIMNAIFDRTTDAYLPENEVVDKISGRELLKNIGKELDSLLNVTSNKLEVHTRKCCDEFEYFNTKSISCKQVNDSKKFTSSIKNILNDTAYISLNMHSESLKCGENIPPKTVLNVSTSTHVLEKSGLIYEKMSRKTYNTSEYCIELVGDNFETSLLTLAYCEKPAEEPDIVIRKCCKQLQFFNTNSVSCDSLLSNEQFQENVLSIMSSSHRYSLYEETLTCADGSPPNVVPIDQNKISIDKFGNVVDSSIVAYDLSEYCLENVGTDYHSAQFTLVHCQKTESLSEKYYIRKCCGEFEFFETSNASCTTTRSNSKFISEFSSLIVSNGSPFEYHLEPEHLVCPDGNPPETNFLISNQTHQIMEGGRVVEISSNDVYSQIEYCFELVGSSYSEAHFTFAYCSKPKKPLKIRKCCKEFEFFNTGSISCSEIETNVKFTDNMTSLIAKSEENSDYNLESSPLKCADGSPPQMNYYVSNQTHNLVEEGRVLDLISHVLYEQNEYCLELVGSDYSKSQFTFVHCHKIAPDYYYYDYNADIPEENAVAELNEPNHISVRKCCQENEYYNTGAHKCIKYENAHSFKEFVLSLSFSNVATDVVTISSRLIGCPDGITLPTIHTISNSTHRLRHNGDLFDLATGDSYNYSFYCMEKIGQSEFNLAMTIALCHKANHILPKCCPIDQYFDEDELNCLPIPRLAFPKIKLIDNYKLDNSSYAVEPLSYFLVCQNALPAKESADQFFLRGSDLCLQDSCYNKKEYCIEYVGDSSLSQLKAIAYFCRQRYFVKCCGPDEILSTESCTKNSQGKSLLLKQLTRTRSVVRNFNYEQCKNENALLLEDSFTDYIQWWLGEDGSHLVVQSDSEVRHISHYCIEDFKDDDGKIRPSAYVCEEDVKNMIPAQRQEPLQRVKGGLGKCCPKSTKENQIYFFSYEFNECQITTTNTSRNLIDYIEGANFTKEYFHDFPNCHGSEVGYLPYPLYFKGDDYVNVTPDGKLKIISMDGKCIEKESIIHDADFCFEHIMRADGYLEASAVVCTQAVKVVEVYNEKFGLLTTLLGISCVCLFATLVSLFTMRVRRGLVYTRKVNTLAGRILVSFVGSHLIGFLTLSISLFENSLNSSTGSGCYVLAGMIQFFNLATFCWNTSICLESLLLTIHVSISDLVRYCLHSIWAWGFPAMITLMMFLMDHYHEDLPCGIITPRIGLRTCFHSSSSAMLLYFFLPIFITLLANVVFLVGAKMLRAARLKRLEKGKPKSAQNGAANADGTKPAHSGMRTHQNQNTKAESLRVVLWTGGTWFIELAGFVVSRYILPPQDGSWLFYLWYIPTSINALRGVGIFAIISFTPEVRAKIKTHSITLRNKIASKLSKVLPDDAENSVGQNTNENRRRNMSITTMLSSIYFSRTNSVTARFKSSTKKGQEINDLKPPEARTRKLGLAKSVSQLGSFSSESASTEEMGSDERKNSASILPKVQEEDTTSTGDEKTEEGEKETSFC